MSKNSHSDGYDGFLRWKLAYIPAVLPVHNGSDELISAVDGDADDDHRQPDGHEHGRIAERFFALREGRPADATLAEKRLDLGTAERLARQQQGGGLHLGLAENPKVAQILVVRGDDLRGGRAGRDPLGGQDDDGQERRRRSRGGRSPRAGPSSAQGDPASDGQLDRPLERDERRGAKRVGEDLDVGRELATGGAALEMSLQQGALELRELAVQA